ncbi:MAG: hypothetical protein ABFE01_08590 [Phycisphaerales bacterium]|jgi:hypothetical protein
MAVEDEYLDVLHGIESAIVATYRDLPEITDYEVIRALEAVIDSYKAEERGRTPREFSPSSTEAALYDTIRLVCQWWLGRAEDSDEADDLGPAPKPIRVDEILLCLKKILTSVNRWTRSGGRTGYLTFIVQYVR